MKIFFCFLLSSFYFSASVIAQLPTPTENQHAQMETMVEKRESVAEDDSYELDLDEMAQHPIQLNEANEADLKHLPILNILQVQNFITYRKLLGPLLSIYELQAVPGWTTEIIRQLMPYITVSRNVPIYESFKERMKKGAHSILLRAGQTLEKSRGFLKPPTPEASYYQGSLQRIFLRYNYNYNQLLSFGFTGDKDPGEPFFRGAQRYGFDFYSFHFFMQRLGIVRALAIGDFTINLGQGLIQWQSFSFTKTTDAMNIIRQSDCVRPYRSAGEFNFHRGIAITLEKRKWQGTFFVSYKGISANQDTTGDVDRFTSFQNSGYHRTAAEISDRNNTKEFSTGTNIRYTAKSFMMGFNMISYQFSRPFQKQEEPYNVFSFKGKRLSNYSLDYHYTWRNIHLFGEYAFDGYFHRALLQGALISLNENLDLSFLYRNISPAFQSLYADAFTENTSPANEKGFYAGMSLRPLKGFQVNLFYDLFVFPWLRYRVDAPSRGNEWMIKTSYQPEKSWWVSAMFRTETKAINAGLQNEATHALSMPVKHRLSTETNYTASRTIGISGRLDLVWIKEYSQLTGRGFSGQIAGSIKKPGWSVSLALAIFETSNYDSRIYVSEPDLLYNYALPVYSGSGIHYYIVLYRDFRNWLPKRIRHIRLSSWLKWSQTFYPGSSSIGSGLDEIKGDRRSEIRAQIILQWQRDRN